MLQLYLLDRIFRPEYSRINEPRWAANHKACLDVMPNAYIVIEYGNPRVTHKLTPYAPNRLSAMGRSWAHCRAFDEVSRYEARPEREPSFSLLQRLLAHTIYNPPAGVQVGWQVAGACSLKEIIEEVERGLEIDDDIIQQWFSAEDVLRILRSAKTFDEMVDRVRYVCGEFETDDRLREIVDIVLGKRA